MQPWIGRAVVIAILAVLAGLTPPWGVPADGESGEQSQVEAATGDRQEQIWLYPAYALENGEKRWGYMDGSGSFVIAPQFDSAEEFGADGLAIVQRDDGVALIDLTGRVVYQSASSYLSASPDGIYIDYADGVAKLIDRAGVVTVDADGVDPRFADGLARFSRDGRYGYVRRDGTVAIAPIFASATAFAGGTAAVRLADGPWAVIDANGNRLLELDVAQLQPGGEGMFLYQEKGSWLWGYRSLAGDASIAPQFTYAMPFSDGLAVVTVGEDYLSARYGVIDKDGAWVIPAEYGYIGYLGDGLFEVARPPADGVPPLFLPHALFNAEGEQLTPFLYYDMVLTPLGVSVSDEATTYFLDRTGRPSEDLPTLNGVGTMRLVGDLIAAEVDGTLSYLTRDGKVVWQSPESWTLPGGARVVDRKHRNGRDVLVHYPELHGLPDPAVQAEINHRLKAHFLGDDLVTERPADFRQTVEISFTAQQVGNVLVVERSGYVYPFGAAHGMPYRDYYHFDLNTGAEYRLSDLFKPGAPYTERLRELVSQQIAADPGGLFDPNPEVRPDQPFAAGADALRIYWAPYEIAPYAAGFPTFTIPYADIQALINTDGAFWKALRGE